VQILSVTFGFSGKTVLGLLHGLGTGASPDESNQRVSSLRAVSRQRGNLGSAELSVQLEKTLLQKGEMPVRTRSNPTGIRNTGP
jgi:hypothetical protein